jgi:hypothetical protein
MIATLCEPANVRVEISAAEATHAEDHAGAVAPSILPKADDVPDERWSLGELTARVIAERGRIEREEKSVTVPHWYLGRALNAARKRFKRVEWGDWLKRCEVTEDVARDARALAKLYGTPDLLAVLSVREAIRLAKGEEANPTTARLLRNLDARLQNAAKATREVAQKLQTAAERAALAKSIEQLVAALTPLAAIAKENIRGQT